VEKWELPKGTMQIVRGEALGKKNVAAQSSIYYAQGGNKKGKKASGEKGRKVIEEEEEFKARSWGEVTKAEKDIKIQT